MFNKTIDARAGFALYYLPLRRLGRIPEAVAHGSDICAQEALRGRSHEASNLSDAKRNARWPANYSHLDIFLVSTLVCAKLKLSVDAGRPQREKESEETIS